MSRLWGDDDDARAARIEARADAAADAAASERDQVLDGIIDNLEDLFRQKKVKYWELHQWQLFKRGELRGRKLTAKLNAELEDSIHEAREAGLLRTNPNLYYGVTESMFR